MLKEERKVAGSILEGAVAISNRVKVEFSRAYSRLMCNCVSVICVEFSLQKYRPGANIKKKLIGFEQVLKKLLCVSDSLDPDNISI